MNWSFGRGSYNKRLSDYLRLSPPGPTTLLPSSLWAFFAPAADVAARRAQAITYASASARKIPVYYIWIKDPEGRKHFAEWPFSRRARDSYYALLAPNMAGAPNDATRKKLLKLAQAAPGIPSLLTLARWKSRASIGAVKEDIGKVAEDRARRGATGAVVPLLLGAGVIVLLLRSS